MEARIAKLLRNTLSNVGLRVLRQLLTLTVVPVMVTWVGEEGYGLLLLTASILGYFGLLGAGVPAGTVKYIAEYDAKDDRKMVHSIINTSIAFFLLVGSLGALALVLGAKADVHLVFNISPDQLVPARNLLFVAAALVLASSVGEVMKSTLKGLQEFHRMNVIEGVAQVSSLCAAIVAAISGLSLPAIFAIQHGVLLLQYPLMYREVRAHLPDWRPAPWNFEGSTFKLVFSLSVWLLLAQIASLLFYTTDQIILGLVLPVAALTAYKIVTTPFHVIRQFAAMFNSAVMPAVSALEEAEGESARNAFLHVGARYSNAMVACLAMCGVLLSRPFIGIWVGPEYVEYAWIAEVACAFQLVWQSNGFFGVVYIGTGRAFRLTFLSIMMALLNLGLSIWWAHTLGVAGVVLATMVAGCVGVPLQYLWLMPALKVERLRYLWNVVGAQVPAVVLALAVLPARGWLSALDNWLSLIAVGAGLSLLMFGVTWRLVVEEEHRAYVVRAIKRRLARAE